MIPKNCTRCGNLALVSISFLVSTVNRPERKQKCGKAVLLCDVCIREFLRCCAWSAPRRCTSMPERRIRRFLASAMQTKDTESDSPEKNNRIDGGLDAEV